MDLSLGNTFKWYNNMCPMHDFIPYMHAGFSSVILSTIERQYQFSSTAAGLISSTYDLAVLVSVVFISYFGGKGHKPRWLGISLIIQGTGTFMCKDNVLFMPKDSMSSDSEGCQFLG